MIRFHLPGAQEVKSCLSRKQIECCEEVTQPSPSCCCFRCETGPELDQSKYLINAEYLQTLLIEMSKTHFDENSVINPESTDYLQH